MTRIARYKAQYFAVVACGSIAVTAVIFWQDFSATSIILVLCLGFLPGRVLGYFWRDLLRGLRLLRAREFAESKRHSERFLVTLAKRPWIKHLVWLGSSRYSRDPLVLALNNIGAAEIGLGNLDAAAPYLLRAIEADNQCPLPSLNLAILHKKKGNLEEAERCFQTMVQLGYTNGFSDRIVRSSQCRFAAIDGAGKIRS